ncbi:MAG: hypothetical protein IPK32_05020 [Verrucomicrobiaceae bacterium]|nr:hypothetical protein [Verrucomicrobiaceae bacterium]
MKTITAILCMCLFGGNGAISQETARNRGTVLSILDAQLTDETEFPSGIEQKEDEQRIEMVSMGDWSGIHQAYLSKDVRLLWQYWELSRRVAFGFGKTNDSKGRIGLPHSARESYSKDVSTYITELLTKTPGHALLLADEIDRYPLKGDVRIRNLRALSKMKTPEAIQQLARFLDDERGEPTKEQKDRYIKWAQEQSSKSDFPFVAHGQGLCYDMVGFLDFALEDDSPVLDLRKANGGFLADVIAARKRLKTWWASDASLKYRQPPAAQLAPEPVPPKIDMKEWLKAYQAKKSTAAPSSQQNAPQTTSDSPSWLLWGGGALTVVCIVWLSSQRKV